MKFFVSLFFSCISILTIAQLNVDSLSHINYQTLHGANLNDVWGYVDETGNEYAIVGTSKGTSVVDVSDPANPQEIFWVPGTESIWRDPCVYGDHAYVTTEAEDGLLIIDLTPLPGSTVLPTTVYTGVAPDQWQSAHTCFLDENGYAYIFGANRGNGGVIILDVHTDPMNPQEVGVFDTWYVHDGFVRNDTMYLAHINDGFFSLVDVSVKSAPVLIGTRATPDDFSHNIWPSSSGQFVFTTDEISGAYIAAYDITDPSNIIEVDRTQNSPGQGVIPHNAHVLGDYLVTSYYSDGITIHDVTDADNMILVGHYDTYPGQTQGYDGCWGVYPFLPSGIVLASDITEGLFILGPNYQKACYLRGLITDASTTMPLSGVAVHIAGNDQTDQSTGNGTYATGIVDPGIFSVTYSKVGYYPQTVSVSLAQAVTVQQDIQLVPIPPYDLTVIVQEQGTGLPVDGAQILLKATLIEHPGVTNALGQENLTLYYQETYEIYVAKWGYIGDCASQVIDQNTGVLTLELEKGYHDDFTFDLGWIINGNASSGMWERGEPFATNSGSAPDLDADLDCGDKAYVTGNDPHLHPDTDDVDGGYTLLVSPTMDLTSYTDPYLNFSRWFYCMYGAAVYDTLKIQMSNGINVALLDVIGGEVQTGSWTDRSIRIWDYIPVTNSMQVFVRISDNDPDVNITEAGFDYFYVSQGSVLSTPSLDDGVGIYPNPCSDKITLSGLDGPDEVIIFNGQGKQVQRMDVSPDHPTIVVDALSPGLYLLKIGNEVYRVIKE